MSKETKLRFDLWHLLALIARRSKAEPTIHECPKSNASMPEILHANVASQRFKEAVVHHFMMR